jgi:cytoskeletal protein CcmA (bactofilin family)
MVKGNVVGNLNISDYLAIGENAKILGDIKCSQISIERGAEINGQVSINNQENKKEKNIEIEKIEDNNSL